MAKAYQSFHARAFHADLGGEGLEGALFFTSVALNFHAGDSRVELPLNQLDIRFDDASEGKIIFRATDSGWTIITSDHDVLEFRSVPQIATLADEVESRLTRRELSRRTKQVLIFTGSAALLFWLGMVAMGAMVRSIVAKVPPEVEEKFGSGLMEELKGELDFEDDTNKVAALTAMAKPLLAVLPQNQPWRFYIIEEEAPNAFALPGGHIAVTTGLLKLTQRPEELLGVIAHEVAHVTHKHGFRHTIASAGPLLVLQLFLSGGGGSMAMLAGGSALLVHQSFSQEYEREADDEGWEYLVAARIDPRGMIAIFRKLQAVEPQEGLMPKAFQSHPDMRKRIARLEAKWKKLRPKSGFIQLQIEPEPP